jgi:hypothetical protein
MLGNYNLSNKALNLYKKPSSYRTSYKSSSNSSFNSSSSNLDNEKQEINTLNGFNYYSKDIKKALLYNIGLTIYIVNSREVFRDYTPYKKRESNPIITSGGPIYAKGHGNTIFKVLY